MYQSLLVFHRRFYHPYEQLVLVVHKVWAHQYLHFHKHQFVGNLISVPGFVCVNTLSPF